MFPFRTKPPARTAVGWEHLVIRPDTKLSPADRRRVEKAIRRAKKEGKIARTAQQTIPYKEMYQDGICHIQNQLYSKSVCCEDINYKEASDDEKTVLFELYCKLVNYFGPSVGFELSVVCYVVSSFFNEAAKETLFDKLQRVAERDVAVSVPVTKN